MIYTFSREAIERGIDLVEPYALISISTPKVYGGTYSANRAQAFDEDNHAASLPADEFRLDILRLAFWDLDESSLHTDIMKDDRFAAQIRLYSPEDARRVARFVKAWTVNLVIHCDAGISRSQGMANAIADHLSVEAGERIQVKHSTRGMPNRHVYRLTWEALRPAEKGIPKEELAARAWAGSAALQHPVTRDVPFQFKPAPSRDKYRIKFMDADKPSDRAKPGSSAPISEGIRPGIVPAKGRGACNSW